MRSAGHRARLLAWMMVVVAIITLGRLARAPEWTVLTGGTQARVRVCRTVYRKAGFRAAWCLERLLQDRSYRVVAAAIEALSRRPDLHERLADSVARHVDSPVRELRVRAFEFLIQNATKYRSELIGRARRELSSIAACEEHSALMSACLRAMAESNDADTVPWLLGMLDDAPDSVLRNAYVVADYPDVLRPHRNSIVSRLDATEERQRLLLVHWLTAVDGVMRGYWAVDWEGGGGRTPGPAVQLPALDSFTFEAEWASNIAPQLPDRREGG